MEILKMLIAAIKNLFKKKAQPKPEDGFDFKPNWGFIIPHTEDSPGAISKEKGISEYGFAIKMASLTRYPKAFRNFGGVLGAAVALKTEHNVNATIEPHKNAFNGTAHGFELLVMKGDKLSASYARHIVEAFADKYPARKLRGDNGIKWVESGDRGFNNLKSSKRAGIDVAILSEAFFIDNPKEWITHQEMAKFWKTVLV